MKTCFIFGAGEFHGIVEAPKAGDCVLAADGGYTHCVQAGVPVDLLLGDFDSLDSLPQDVPLVQFPPEKDDTDTMLALKHGLAQGFSRFVLYGCAGGRLDHTLGNLQALLFLAEQQAQGFLYTDSQIFTAIHKTDFAFHAPQGAIFSVFCLGKETPVSIEGAQYAVQHVPMSASFPLGLSNVSLGGRVCITAHEASLLLALPCGDDVGIME